MRKASQCTKSVETCEENVSKLPQKCQTVKNSRKRHTFHRPVTRSLQYTPVLRYDHSFRPEIAKTWARTHVRNVTNSNVRSANESDELLSHTKTLKSVHPSEHEGVVCGVYQDGYGGGWWPGYPGVYRGGTGVVCSQGAPGWYSSQYLVSRPTVPRPRPTVPRPTVPGPRLQYQDLSLA